MSCFHRKSSPPLWLASSLPSLADYDAAVFSSHRNANVRHAALGLHHAGLLGEFWTCLDYRETAFLKRVVPGSVARQLRRRTFPPELASVMRSSPFRELARMLAPRAGLRSLVRHEQGPLSVDAVYRSLDRTVSQRLNDDRFRGVYAYEDGAEESFRV